jgi:ankyrin repeat protein
MNNKIFNLLNDNNYDELKNLIKNNKNTNLNIKDENKNYFIYLVLFKNNYPFIKFLFDNYNNFKLDFIDLDNRTILYHLIKINNLQIIKLLIEYDKKIIGFSLVNLKDKYGNTSLMYCVIFNRFDILKFLIENNANLFDVNTKKNNVFFICNQYKRNNILKYLLTKTEQLNFTNFSGENILQNSITMENFENAEYLLNFNIDLNYQDTEYGFTIFHQLVIINKLDFVKKIINKINLNKVDFLGNTPLHYCLVENTIDIFNFCIKNKSDNINFNILNLDGNSLLHLYLKLINETNNDILNILLSKSNLNIQNNNGVTPLNLLFDNNLFLKFKDILETKELNIFVPKKNNLTIYDNFIKDNKKDKDDFINIIINSFYNELIKNKSKLIEKWEFNCGNNDLNELKNIFKVKDKNLESICKEKIKKVIIEKNRSIPLYKEINLKLVSGIMMNNCFYVGSIIDILFNLIWLKQNTSNLQLVLEYSLINNTEVLDFKRKIGNNFYNKLDFYNVEILWTYQKIFFPTYFNTFLNKKLSYMKYNYVIIPIGIETEKGFHSNMLFWDLKANLVERFEPYGSGILKEYYYNPELLDMLLEKKFKLFNENIKYVKPIDYLPPIGFQYLEILEDEKCKMLGDPNGFCSVWCAWWCYQKINNPTVPSKVLVNKLIELIKLRNLGFKNVIRNFSTKIIKLRDNYLNNLDLNINKWLNNEFNEKQIKKLEEIILNII